MITRTGRRRIIVLCMDLVVVFAAYVLAFLLRFDFRLDEAVVEALLSSAPYALVCYLASSFFFGVNRGLRFYASFGDTVDVVKAAVFASACQALVVRALGADVPGSVVIAWPLLAVCALAAHHACLGCVNHYLKVRMLGGGKRSTALIVGVGDLAELVFQNMRSDEAVDYRVVGFYDGNNSRFGLRLHGTPVLVGVPELTRVLNDSLVDEVVIAVQRHQRAGALEAVADALQGVSRRPIVLVAPTLEEMLHSNRRAEPRKVRPADLLNRRVISLDTGRIGRSLEGKCVLISGAGGTIGGELARQVARYKPRKLVLLENSATALFYSEAAIREEHPQMEVLATLGDVRDLNLLDRLFRTEKPAVVFHAAAHKHVHQLETNVSEGISNNLLGTYQLATAAEKHEAESFILISTDKAVRPSCVMGATKRAAEMVVSNLARRSKTRFASVRFGNVLGSSGSVLKIFQEQIEKGQPITLTHPDATRFFMTVEEAVGLVLQASALAKGGEIFVLKMGEQIRIMDMAKALIRLSGLEPELDVPIRITGLRPGEKLSEELIEDETGQEESEHPDIMVLRSENKEVDELAERILGIELLTTSAEKDAMLRALVQLVPTFTASPGHDGARVRPVGDQTEGTSIN